MMKRFTLFAVAALMAVTTAVAQQRAKTQGRQKVQHATAQAKAPERPVLKLTDATRRAASQQTMIQLPKAAWQKQQSLRKQADNKQLQPRKQAAKKAPRRAAGIITEQPAGTYHNMLYGCSYFGYSLFGFYNGTYTAAFGEVVEGTDGCLYIHNMLTEMYTEEGYWVKAEKVDGQADTYVIHKQPIYEENYYGELYTYSIMKVKLNDEGTSFEPAANTDIKITWKNGVLRTASEFNNPNSFSTCIGAIDDSGYWSGALNWNVTMTEQTEQPITELPAGVEAFDAVVSYTDGPAVEPTEEDEYVEEPTKGGFKTKMAVSGNDIYVQLYDGLDSWVKGTIDGDKATFATGQYLGGDSYYGQHIYLVAGDANCLETGQLVNKVTFNYDAASKKLSGSNCYLFVNGGKDQIYYVSLFYNPDIYQFVEVAATPQPADESSFYFSNYEPSYGYGYFDFDIPSFDTEGNFIDPAKMSYKVYIGTEEEHSVFTFQPEEYYDFLEPTTEIPYTLSGGNFWRSGASHEFVLYFNNSKGLGIQTVYKGGGETRESDIAWYGPSNGAVGFESVFPQVENPEVYTKLAAGEMAVKLGEPYYNFGSGRADTESYDVAMKIADDWSSPVSLNGKKITAITVPVLSVDGLSNAKVWLSTSIKLNADGTFTPNITSKAFTPTEAGFVTVTLDEPYTIAPYNNDYDEEDNGVYIGYSFTQIYDEETGEAAAPIALTRYTNTGGFMIHTDKVYRYGWADMTGLQGDLALEAVLQDGDVNAAGLGTIADVTLKTGESGTTKAQVINYGSAGLNKVNYDYRLLGFDGENEFNLTGSGELSDIGLPAVFGGYKTVDLDIPAVSVPGDHIFYANATKANGVDNAVVVDEYSWAQGNVFVMNFLPKKRPLMEEYTGTWCGYCPRGYVALEKMAELYPEDFIALSYHDEDPMEVMSRYDYPSYVTSFPTAYLDRELVIDAYKGDTGEDFGIEDTWKQRCNAFAAGDIDVEASWSEDMKTINVKSKVKFPRSNEYANYTIAYAVSADGLTGTGSDWAQSNYYANGAYGYPLYMDQFTNGESYVEGLVFNDVLVALTDGIEGSVPEAITEGEEYTYEYSFDATSIKNTSGEDVIQDKSKVKVVAMLLEWGSVLNANKCQVSATPSAISDVTAGADRVVKTEYFDLSGRKVRVPSAGVYIQSRQYKDGHTVNRTVVVK